MKKSSIGKYYFFKLDFLQFFHEKLFFEEYTNCDTYLPKR